MLVESIEQINYRVLFEQVRFKNKFICRELGSRASQTGSTAF